MRLQRAAALLLSVAISGCGGDPNGGSGAESIRASSAPELKAVPIARIGSLDDPDQTLTRVGNVVIGPEEELYVSQPTDGNVRVYDSRGSLVRTIGRRGEGPGEFGRPVYLGFSGDTLYVTDNELGRLSFFAQDGTFIRSKQWTTSIRSMRTSTGVDVAFDATVPQVLLADGTAFVAIDPIPFYVVDPSFHDPLRLLGELPQPYVHVDAKGQPIDTVSQPLKEGVLFGVTAGGPTWYFAVPFSDSPLSALMPDGRGVVMVDRGVAQDERGATFKIVLVGLRRDTVFARAFSYGPAPVADGVVREAAERIHSAHSRGPNAAAIERSLRTNDLIPRTQPPITALSVGQDGSIWLRREDLAGDSTLWNVLDRTGELRGALRLPAGDSIVAARGDLVVAVYADELDVPYVVTYRLDR